MRYRHQIVNVDQMDPNPWNPNQMDAAAEVKLDAAIRRLGVFKPIIVRENSGRLEIIGGQHRWESAKRLGMEEIPVVAGAWTTRRCWPRSSSRWTPTT